MRVIQLASALAPLLFAGCGDNNNANSDAAVAIDGAHADGAADAPTVTTTSVSGSVTDQITGDPIANAQVCATGLTPEPCATPMADGTYTLSLSLPDGMSQIAQLATAAGFLGRNNEIVEDPTAANGHNIVWETLGGLYSTAEATKYLSTQAGFTYPSTSTGFVVIQVAGENGVTPAPSATATISDGSAKAVYGNGSGTPDRQLTATTGTEGTVLFGNLAPGTYAVTVRSAGGNCSVEDGSDGTINGVWPPVGSASASVQIVANALTTGISVQCP